MTRATLVAGDRDPVKTAPDSRGDCRIVGDGPAEVTAYRSKAMSFCPRCKGVLEPRAVSCPHCGYDFAPPEDGKRLPAWMHLLLAGAMVAVFVAFQHNPVVWVVGEAFLLLGWLALVFDVWRFFTK